MLFSKNSSARFISHLDLLRTFERAIRRASLPVAFSKGFNPHSLISFAAPLPVGVAGESECMEVVLTGDVPPERICSLLNNVLPEGVNLKSAWQVQDDAPPIMVITKKASYRLEVETKKPLTNEWVDKYIKSFLSLSEIIVKKKAKEKEGPVKAHDIRPGIYNMKGYLNNKKIIFEMGLQAGSNGNVRPQEVLQAFDEKFLVGLISESMIVIRTGLYPV